MIMPSSTLWGLPSSTARSIKAPGSPSSALQMTYLTSPSALAAALPLAPGGETGPAPPSQPRLLDGIHDLVGLHLKSALISAL